MEFSWTPSPFFLAHLYVPVLYIPKSGSELQPSLSRAFLVARYEEFSRGRLHVFLTFAYWLALSFAKVPGPSGNRGRWPWRMTYAAVGLAARCVCRCTEWWSRGRHHSSSCGRDAGETLVRVSFKPERAFNVIAHVGDWEHAETVRRRCPRTV